MTIRIKILIFCNFFVMVFSISATDLSPSYVLSIVKDRTMTESKKEDKLKLFAKIGYKLDQKSISEIFKLMRTELKTSDSQSDLSFFSFLLSYLADQDKVSHEVLADEFKKFLVFYSTINSKFFNRDFSRKIFQKYYSILFSGKCDAPFPKYWEICQYLFLNNISFFEYLLAEKDVDSLSSACYSNLPKYIEKSFIILKSYEHDALKTLILESFLQPGSNMCYALQRPQVHILTILSKNSIPLISDKSKQILKDIILFPKHSSWKKWWEENSYSILKRACDVLSDKTQSDRNKIIAIKQIKMANNFSPEKLPGDYLDILLRAMHSDDISSDVKVQILIALQAFINIEDDVSLKIATVIADNLNNNTYCLALFPSMPAWIVNKAKIKNKIINVMMNKEKSMNLRGFAAYALRKVDANKKNTALMILNFLKLNIKNDTRGARLALAALESLTSKNCGIDIDAWRKAINVIPDDSPTFYDEK